MQLVSPSMARRCPPCRADRPASADDRRAAPFRQRLGDGAIVRMQPTRQHGLLAPRDPVRHQHRFAARGRAVVHRGVGDIHAGQQRHLRLELEQHLQRALRDFRLIRRVARQELGALDQVIDARRHVMPVRAGADEERHRAGSGVARGEPADLALDRDLALRQREGRQFLEQLAARHIGKEVVDRTDADLGEHVRPVGRVEREITHRRCLAMTRLRQWCAGIPATVTVARIELAM